VLKVAWSSVLANKIRLLLTSFSIVIGVAFVAGSFVFTDTITTRFDRLFADISAGVDVYVQPVAPEFGNDFGQVELSMPQDVLNDVLAVDGVNVAEAGVGGFAQLVDSEGDVVGGFGPPTLGFSWSQDPDMTPLRIAPENGRPPQTAGEVAIDVATARTQGYEIGDTVSLLFTGPVEHFTLVGLANFGDEDNVAGATLAIFEFEEAQRLFGLEGRISQISVSAEPGVLAEDLAARIGSVLSEDVEAITAAQSTADQTAEIQEGLGFLTIGLLVFAVIAVFVGSFVIYNTFRIIVAQRTRELALLRAIGATGGQVTRMVVLEAFIVALVSSVIGIFAGIGLSLFLAFALSAAGLGFPDGPMTVLPRTVIVGLLVGVVVTLVASVVPARSASRISPVAAMQADLSATPRKTLRKRTIVGLGVSGAGFALVAVGLFGDFGNNLQCLGLGAVVAFVGISILAPIAARPFATFVGWPIRKIFNLFGDHVSAELAVQNTRRQPRRTASTASALMIGVTLIVFVAIFAASIKVSVGNTVAEIFPADISVSSSNFTIGVSPDYTENLRALPEIGQVTTLNSTQIRIQELGIETDVAAIEPDTAGGMVFSGASDEDLAELGRTNGLLIREDFEGAGGQERAEEQLGKTFTIELPNGTVETGRVVGVFTDGSFGDYIITRDRFVTGIEPVTDAFVLANAAEGVSVEAAKLAAEDAALVYPNAQVQTKTELVADAEAQIDGLLIIFTALLGLAIIIAILGITNTLALSIIERTREIGLLRAVGMSRRQLRRMIRWESVIVAVFGAFLGMLTGIALGWAVVQALKDEGLGDFALPVGQLVTLIGVAAIAGVFAAIYPAYKASRLNILDAISYQ